MLNGYQQWFADKFLQFIELRQQFIDRKSELPRNVITTMEMFYCELLEEIEHITEPKKGK